jgi:hypothetical protein
MIFLNGNTDVVTRILEFVADTSEELNTCATISQVFLLSRNDPRLDQTRTGTIILRTRPESIPPEVWQRWDQQVFTGNRARLVVILAQLQHETIYSRSSPELPFALTNVREVVLQRDSSLKVPESKDDCDIGGLMVVGFFKKILPNLDVLDIGALAVTASDLGSTLLNTPVMGALHDLRASVIRCTTEVAYSGCHFLLMQPYPFLHYDNSSVNFNSINNMNNLREIHIDPFGVQLLDASPPIAAYCQALSQLELEPWFDFASENHGGADWVLLQEYPNLERVTLKHAEYYVLSMLDPGGFSWKILPQEALMKFVRHTPKLRWFCSDLTPENIAILKEERPEVDFCN